jgi:hypothetical protein
MGGSISVDSEGIAGKGTKFSFFIIAAEEIKISELQTTHQEIIRGAKIMVVDDRAEYRIQLTDMLFKWGCFPLSLSSGEEALQHLTYNPGYDCIIVDICMPYMSGIELAQSLRESYKHIPLIALSSVEVVEGGVELFDHYMNKPIDQNFLFPALLDCLIKKQNNNNLPNQEKIPSGRISPSTALNKRVKKAKNKLKILIVEDDPNNSYTIKEMLGYLGFNPVNIKTVDNGEKCIEEVKRKRYDAVLMDIIMPIMDGIEATKHIRQLHTNARPYIIAVSAAVQNSDKHRCHQVGIDGYLTKPVLKEKLEAALSPLVKN